MTDWTINTTKTATTFSTQNKSISSFTMQEVSNIDAFLKIDSVFHLLIDSTYKLLIQPQSRLTNWGLQNKN